MIPTVEDSIDNTAFLLGDEQKKRFSSASLVKAVGLAWQEMISEMISCGLDNVELTTIYTLPAGIATLSPATALIPNLGALIRVRERPPGQTYFTIMTPVQILPVIGAGNGLGYYHWSGGVFSFTPIALDAQLEFTYYASGQLPDSGSLGVDNCLLVVAKLATSYAGPGKGINQLAAKYRAEVEKNDFHRMIQPILRSQQSGRVQRGAYSAGSSGGGRSNQIPTA